MSKGTRNLGRAVTSRGARVAAQALIAAFATACSSELGGAGTATETTTGGATVGGGGDNAGGASSTGTNTGGTGAGSGSGGIGGMPDPKCATDADCTNDPKGAVCDTATGGCVGCLTADDKCAVGEYCDPATQTCAPGCTDDADCGGGNDLHCNLQTNQCVGCLIDTDCPLSQICFVGGNTCVPGCSATQGCAMPATCCNDTVCYDLTTDVNHCGDCATPCAVPENAAASCASSICGMGACNPGFADCDGDSTNGCEWNVLQDGPCLCSPGNTQSCYSGGPGTQGIGPCKAGTQTCLDGVQWSACTGQTLPVSEVCGNSVDDDCDGLADNVGDADGDGWTACNGDCCDSPGACGSSPKLINPGAFEVVGNGVDDDCDPATSDVVAVPACSTVQDFSGVTASDVAKAIDICQTTTANAPIALKKWGLITASNLLANGTVPNATALADIRDKQSAILVNYGTGGIVPKKGPTMAGISSGVMRDQGDAGFAGTSSGLTTNSVPPAVYLAAHGNALPSSAGCSGNCPPGSGANDSVNIRLQIRVPTNAQSFSYDFRFVSAEYWDWQCTLFNDFYLALLTTAAPGVPADKNISFDGLGNPMSVNNGFFDVCVAKDCNLCPAGNAALAGTGMTVGNTGGATKWLTTDSPIVPGETMQLELMVFDVSDDLLDSLTLLDNFRWNLSPSVVGTHE